MEFIYYFIVLAIAIMVVIRFHREQFTIEPKVLLFYKSDDPECQHFLPIWGDIAKNNSLRRRMIFSKIDVNDKQNTHLLKHYKVHVYPSIFINNRRIPRAKMSSSVQLMNHLNSFK